MVVQLTIGEECMEIVILIIGIIQGVAFGCATNQIIKNKGYKENWFWWGFFFSFLAVIVAATKPDNHANQQVIVKTEDKSERANPVIMKELSSNDFADKVDIKTPIHITSWNIKRENSDIFLYVNFINIGDLPISAVMFKATGFNSFSDKIKISGKDEFEVMGQDYNLFPGMSENIKIILPDEDIRKVDIKVKKVCFSDGTIYECSNSVWINTKQEPLEDKYLEFVKQDNPVAKFYSIIKQDYWQCVCGFVNIGKVCRACNMKKTDVFQFTREQIAGTYNKYLIQVKERKKKEEQVRLEAEQIAAEEEKRRIIAIEQEQINRQKQRKRNVKIVAICGSVVLLGIIGTFVFNYMSKMEYMNSQREESKYDLDEIEKILARETSVVEYEKQYNVLLIYDNDKEMYRAEEYDICGTKGILYWKVNDDILCNAYIDFGACNEKLSSSIADEIIDYLNSTIGEPKEERHQMGGWFYRIWESDDIRFYLGSGSHSDIGPYEIEFKLSKYRKPITNRNTDDEVITLMQKFSNGIKVEDVEEMMGEATEKNNNSIIYRKYKDKFNGLEGDIKLFYDSDTLNITSIRWEYETDDCLSVYEKCTNYLKDKFGDYYASPQKPERKNWNDFSLFYDYEKTTVILEKSCE